MRDLIREEIKNQMVQIIKKQYKGSLIRVGDYLVIELHEIFCAKNVVNNDRLHIDCKIYCTVSNGNFELATRSLKNYINGELKKYFGLHLNSIVWNFGKYPVQIMSKEEIDLLMK